MTVQAVSYQPSLKTLETRHKNNRKLGRIKTTVPSYRVHTSFAAIWGVQGRFGGARKGSCQLLARKEEADCSAKHLMRALSAGWAAVRGGSWHLRVSLLRQHNSVHL